MGGSTGLKRRIALEPQALQREAAAYGDRFIGNLGGTLFVLLPAFALWMKLAYLNRRMRYTEHLVFALHVHSVWFLLLGVVGNEIPPPPPGSNQPPRISLSINQTPAMQEVLVKFFKDGHEGIWLESRRGAGAWEFVSISTKSPYTDTRALLNPAQAEVREYRAMFWDSGQPNGDWCDVAKITVSP